MSELARRAARRKDVPALPENLVGEILHGVLPTLPRPAPRRAQASSALDDTITGPVDGGAAGHRGW